MPVTITVTMPSKNKATCTFMHDTTDWYMPVTGVEHARKTSQNPTTCYKHQAYYRTI